MIDRLARYKCPGVGICKEGGRGWRGSNNREKQNRAAGQSVAEQMEMGREMLGVTWDLG